MLGTKNLGDILSERESIAKDMQVGGEMQVGGGEMMVVVVRWW